MRQNSEWSIMDNVQILCLIFQDKYTRHAQDIVCTRPRHGVCLLHLDSIRCQYKGVFYNVMINLWSVFDSDWTRWECVCRYSCVHVWYWPNTMRRVCVLVEPSGFSTVQRYMEPLSSAGTLSRTRTLPSLSALPSSSSPPTRVHVNRGSGNTSFCTVCKHTEIHTFNISHRAQS